MVIFAENLLKGHCPVRSSSEQKNRLMDSHSVYVSSHTPLRPITELTLPELSTSIIDARLIDSLVNELGISTPTKLQTWLWPAIANGHNSIIAMESRGISLTLGWLAPILSFVFEGQVNQNRLKNYVLLLNLVVCRPIILPFFFWSGDRDKLTKSGRV